MSRRRLSIPHTGGRRAMFLNEWKTGEEKGAPKLEPKIAFNSTKTVSNNFWGVG